MNPWLLLIYGIGWIVVAAVGLAILIFLIMFVAAVWQTIQQGIAIRREQSRITAVSILSSQPPRDSA